MRTVAFVLAIVLGYTMMQVGILTRENEGLNHTIHELIDMNTSIIESCNDWGITRQAPIGDVKNFLSEITFKGVSK